MASRASIPFLVAMMLLTGVCNTLLTKYQDKQCVRNCDGLEEDRQEFKQPVIQTMQMFMGEAGTWLVVFVVAIWERYRPGRAGYEALEDSHTSADDLSGALRDSTDTRRPVADSPAAANSTPATKPVTVIGEDGIERIPLTGWKVCLLASPACCDIIGTTLMNVGLLFVAASIYQMTRGALVLFVGLFSVIFLRRHLSLEKWLSLFIVVLGVAVVGLAGAIQGDDEHLAHPESYDDEFSYAVLLVTRDFVKRATVEALSDGENAARTIFGVLLIAAAQIFTATQFVLEESIMRKYAMAPIKVVGWEGVFGLSVTVFGMIVMHLLVGRTETGRYGYFDAREGLHEFFSIPSIGWTSLLIMISIGGFNFFGLSVTRTVSATSRSTIDTCRTLFIWIVSLGLGWETFKWLQVIGFALLVYGTFVFNDLVKGPLFCGRRERQAPLLRRDDLDEDQSDETRV